MKKREKMWLTAIGIVTALIWVQSLVPASQSGAESDAVAEMLKAILGESSFAEWVVTHVRKIAHFTEFAVLGVTWGGFALGRRRGAWPLIPGLLTAAADEALQFVSPERAPMVTDVLLDWTGFAAGWALFSAFMWVWRKIHRKNTEKP